MSENQTYFNMEVSKHEYLIMLYFLSLCGNVFFETFLPQTIYVITAFIFVLLYLFKENINYRFSRWSINNMFIMIATFILLFFAQYVVFEWNTVPGIINHICKFIIGAGIIVYLGERFRIVFFRTMFLLCMIALPLWIIQQFSGGIGGLTWDLGKTIWIYCYRTGGDIVRNCGFFWEPGAMGGYIALLTLLFFNDLVELYKNNRFMCLVILATLLSTQSTGAYMSFGAILVTYLAVSMRSKWKYILFPICLSAAFLIYNNVDFLSDKVESQNESTRDLVWGEYSSTRSGTLYFDLYYIVKHPFIGNGLHERTRLADHHALAQMLSQGEVAAAGNGFSDTIAKWGLIYCFVYGWVFFRTNKELDAKRKLFFLLLICVILQGEAFMNFPLFLGIPLLRIVNDKKIINNKR